jgi:hypothetical protein
MSNNQDGQTCYFCQRGHFRERTEEIAFYQWTNKGYVFCRVTVTVGVCNQCGSRDWNEDIEALIDEAVRREHDKLP